MSSWRWRLRRAGRQRPWCCFRLLSSPEQLEAEKAACQSIITPASEGHREPEEHPNRTLSDVAWLAESPDDVPFSREMVVFPHVCRQKLGEQSLLLISTLSTPEKSRRRQSGNGGGPSRLSTSPGIVRARPWVSPPPLGSGAAWNSPRLQNEAAHPLSSAIASCR